MSEAWSEGYVTDIGYTYGYYREINPVFQRFCLLLKGYSALESATAYHCELGFGQGVSVNIHAAANPGSFIGTDFNPAHAAHANTLAAAFESNTQFFDDSFEQLLKRTDLPQFDSISLHGIWTWISRENHKIIAEFARRYLKPGGIFYISYNCFPGWSPAYPLRQLFSLHDRFSSSSGNVSQRVEAALGFSEKLLAANPIYAQAAPTLGAKLTSLKGQGHNYLAHEYFNRDWNCMYFSDVVDALAESKLDYVATAVPLDVVDAVNLKAEGTEFLNGIDHPILREQARDYFVNQQFRKDLYIRGAIKLSAVEQRERMLDTRFVLLQLADTVPLKVTGALGEATLQPEIYTPLISALASEEYAPKTLRHLATVLPDFVYGGLHQAIAVLVSMGAVAPCQTQTVVDQVKDRCVALNLHLCQEAVFGNRIETLASPLTGGGVTVGRIMQLFLLAIYQGKHKPLEWAQYAWSILSSQGQSLMKEGKTLTTAEENIAELSLEAEKFAKKYLLVLKALKVV